MESAFKGKLTVGHYKKYERPDARPYPHASQSTSVTPEVSTEERRVGWRPGGMPGEN